MFYLNLVYVTYTRDFALFKKDKRYRSFREEKQDFHGEIRSLQKIIRELKKEVSRLRKYEEYCLQNEHFVKKRTEKKQVRKNIRILEEELLNYFNDSSCKIIKNTQDIIEFQINL